MNTPRQDSYTQQLRDALDSLQACAGSVLAGYGDRFKQSLYMDLDGAIRRAQQLVNDVPQDGPNSLPPLTQAMIDAAGAAIWGHASIEKERLIRKAYRAMDDTRTTATHSPTKGA